VERHPVPVNHLLRVARGHKRLTEAPPRDLPAPVLVRAAPRTLLDTIRSLSLRPRAKRERDGRR